MDRGDGRAWAIRLHKYAVDAVRLAVPASGEQAFAHLRDQGVRLVAGAVVHAARPAGTRQHPLLAMACAQPMDSLTQHAVALRDARDRFSGLERAHRRHVAVEHAAVLLREQMTPRTPVPYSRVVMVTGRIG